MNKNHSVTGFPVFTEGAEEKVERFLALQKPQELGSGLTPLPAHQQLIEEAERLSSYYTAETEPMCFLGQKTDAVGRLSIGLQPGDVAFKVEPLSADSAFEKNERVLILVPPALHYVCIKEALFLPSRYGEAPAATRARAARVLGRDIPTYKLVLCNP
jgi:hypothetical protein